MKIIYQDDFFRIENSDDGAFQVYSLSKENPLLIFNCWDSTTAIKYMLSHSKTDLNKLPFGSDYNPPERIVCAANQYENHLGEKVVIAGVRHACKVMQDSYKGHNSGEDIVYSETEIQGFLTNKHRFVDRYEAWKIAVEQNQIVRRCGGDTVNGGKLFSENLY